MQLRFHLMFAFIRRRWILLGCALLATAGMMVDVVFDEIAATPFDVPRYAIFKGNVVLLHGDPRSNFEFARRINLVAYRETEWRFAAFSIPSGCHLHAPEAGWKVITDFQSGNLFVSIPLWLVLASLAGWIVIRELCYWDAAVDARERGEPIVAPSKPASA